MGQEHLKFIKMTIMIFKIQQQRNITFLLTINIIL